MVGIFLVIVALLIPLWVRSRRDFSAGLAYAVVLLVCLPTYLRITLPGELPALTIHRLILLSLLWFWWRNHALREFASTAILRKQFIFWAVASGLSVVFTGISFVSSLRYYLDYVFEVFVFFVVVSTAVRERGQALRLLRALWVGLVIVAILAVIEKYTGFNPVDRFLPGYAREENVHYFDVISTFPQRILLGTAMAMGWPIACGLIYVPKPRYDVAKPVLWISVGLFLAACYFSMSRGPWLATALAVMMLVVAGSRVIRKKLLLVGVLAGVVLLTRPGVLETIAGLAKSTADSDSFKGGTFQYRLELWRIAWSEISKSPVRLLVGYGLGSARETELVWDFTYRDKERQVVSWDNHFACDLYQSGVLGLVANLSLYCGATLLLFRLWRGAAPGESDVMICFLASAAVMLFMMTNVRIFAKQLNFVFWSLILASVAYGGYYSNASDEEPVKPSDEDAVPTEAGLRTW
jgi:hypothetical protein